MGMLMKAHRGARFGRLWLRTGKSARRRLRSPSLRPWMLPFQGEPGADFSALSRSRNEFQSPSGQRRALFHAQQTQARAAHRFVTGGGYVKADAIIAHRQMEPPIHL